MLNDCNAKSAGQNEGDSGIYENTEILMRTDESVPGGEKVVHVAHFFPERAELCTVLSEKILKQFLPHPGKISRLTSCLPSSCWYSL